jgi:hypothetical protein
MSGGRKGKWGITLLAFVVATVLLVMGWLHWRQPREVAAISPPPPPRAAERRLDVSPHAVSTTLTAPPRASTAEPASGTEVCGFGNVPATTADANDINQFVIGKTRKAYDRWKAALLDSSDLRARAIGLVLQRAEFLRDDSAAQADESRDELVQLAAGGQDAAVYAIAASLGERVGGPAERMHQIAYEKEALQQLETSNERNLWSCDTVSRVNTFIVERERLGEVGALRELRDRREPPASQ